MYTKFENEIKLVSKKNEVNPYLALIDLFNIANTENDKGGFENKRPFLRLNMFKTEEMKENELINSKLNKELNKLRRDPYAMNRAKSGEQSNIYNVFVGGVLGYFTHPVKYWKIDSGNEEKVLENWVKNWVISYVNEFQKILNN